MRVRQLDVLQSKEERVQTNAVPSEGVFAMSMAEESPSSSAADLFESMQLKRRSPVNIPLQRCYTVPASLFRCFARRAPHVVVHSSCSGWLLCGLGSPQATKELCE